MFPTSGLFQEYPCPFHSEGSCTRPYCHFSHTAQNQNTTGSTSPKVCESPPVEPSLSAPVYKPTPISVLDQRESSHAADSFETSKVTPSSVFAVPVYQPTPISELEKYSPSVACAYGFNGVHSGATFVRPSNPPTYSPVVRSTPRLIDPPATPTQPTPFVYQPSPAYPPVTDDLVGNPIEQALSPPAAQKIHEFDLSPVVTNSTEPNENRPGSSLEKKLKRRLKNSKIQAKTSPVCLENPTILTAQPPSDLIDEDESSNDLNDVKRQKILSLYNDLYGDHSLPVHNSNSADFASRTKGRVPPTLAIAPYLGKAENALKNSEVGKKVEPQSVSDESTVTLVPRPRAPLRKSDKIPMPIRTRYLDQFIEECLVIYECPNDAYDRALNDEQSCHDKATSRMAYLNAVIQRLKSLKAEKMKVQEDGLRKPISAQYKPKPTHPISPITDEAELAEQRLDEVVRGRQLYEQLRNYILTEQQLIENGFPREASPSGSAFGKAKLAIPEAKRAIYGSCQQNEHICCRCGARFKVDEFGNALVQQKCVYHWGRPVKQRTPGSGFDLRYVCCQSEVGQPGCQLCSTGHVHDSNRWLDCDGFVTTLPPLVRPPPPQTASASSPDEDPDPVNVYALDCEMVYTTAGCELGRVTIVDTKLNPVLDTMVRPYGLIVDCNTRFSGLNRDQLEQVETRITDVQSKLLHLFDSDTILIGHSLESDLLALKLIHNKVVDTSVLFPHRHGPPKKRALRNLACELLHRIIQQDDGGHDSLEDAVVCMQLVQLKVKEDLRRGKWALK